MHPFSFPFSSPISRRQLLRAAAASGAAMALAQAGAAAAAGTRPAAERNKICVFTKPFQSLGFGELADRVAEMGFDGIEAPVRVGGHIEPERVEDELPALVEALKKRGLEVTVMASSINRADQPRTAQVLRTAAALGIKRYRMWYYEYDLKRPVAKQLEELRPVVKDLAALNRDVGIAAVYQNHAGLGYVGAPVWDLYHLIRDIPVEEIGIAFDIRHAAVEGGSCWPVQFNLMQPHLGAVYVKDFAWKGREVLNVPLGEGVVERKFFSMLRQPEYTYTGPISLHEEYIDQNDRALVSEHIAAIKKDLRVLRSWLEG